MLVYTKTEFVLRRDQWCDAVGVQRSHARHTSVLRWLRYHSYPIGFDHTGVYYSPSRKLHFFLTEPYHSIEDALQSLHDLGRKKNGKFSFARGAIGTGLWRPGECVPLLVAKDGYDDYLQFLAAGLPTIA